MIAKDIFLCEFPIKYLNDELDGIITGDLILFGMGSGLGKSTMSRLITNNATFQSCPVVLYSLEDKPDTMDKKEIYLEYILSTGSDDTFRKWKIKYSQNPKEYEQYTRKWVQRLSMKDKETGLKLLNYHEYVEPTNNELLQKVIGKIEEEVAMGYKLFIIDHLDAGLDPTETPAGMKRVMDTLWATVCKHKIAVIAFSQLASTRNKEAITPSLDDLAGSKSKGKVSNMVISMARDYDGKYPNISDTEPTYCRIVKDRDDGRKSLGIVFFEKGHYLPNYFKFSCDESGMSVDGMHVKDFRKKHHEGKLKGQPNYVELTEIK